METQNNKMYTLVTGAGSGLGKEFCLQCAARKQNLLMVSLPGSNSNRIAQEIILEYGVDVQVFEFDMADSILLLEKINHIATHYHINFLINNAGIGGTVLMKDSSLEAIDRILQVNIRSMVLITKKLLPLLVKHDKAHILNVSSMAAFTPIAYKTVYPASKAFISSFSLGLREELHDSSVSVSVLYPGPIMTNSGNTERIIAQGLKGKMGLLSMHNIVRRALKKTFDGKAVIIPGLLNRINHRIMSVLPMGTTIRLVSREVKKEIATP